MSRDTRKRILIASLLLFNDKGVKGTAINEIADEVDISPGNLHYHFRRKSELVEALVEEFQADARRVLRPPEARTGLDEFWLFLHLLLETTAAYRFLLRDMEFLTREYPKAARALKAFAGGLVAAFELQLHALLAGGVVAIGEDQIRVLGRNLAVIALFSERFDGLVEHSRSADESALRVARSVLNALRPYVVAEASGQLDDLAEHYDT